MLHRAALRAAGAASLSSNHVRRYAAAQVSMRSSGIYQTRRLGKSKGGEKTTGAGNQVSRRSQMASCGASGKLPACW